MNIPYYHIVFTIPEELNVFFVEYKRDLLEFLLKASSDTLLELCRDSTHLGAQIGFTSIIHTWGSNMCFHPHIHAMVSSGGITENEQWVSKGSKFFLPVRVVSALFKGKFMARVKELHPQLSAMSDEEYYAIIDKAYQKDWVVYTKEPFKDASQVMNYLGRYTHRVAISESRILNYDGENVTFKYKDYKQNGIWRTMTVSAIEFIRRFVLHILPQRLTKIRHYGFLSPKNKDKRIKLIKELTNTRVFDFIKKTKYQILSDKYGLDFRLCPCCRCSPNTNKRE